MIEQNLLNALMSGWIYILVALGLTLVLGIVGIVQLAHGEIYMIGAYSVYYFCVVLGLNFFLSLIISIFLVGLLGVVLERFFLSPFRNDVEGAIISTIALILILQTAVVAIAGVGYKGIPSPIQGMLVVLGARLSWERLITILAGMVLVSALLIFIKKTMIGQAMVAVSENREVAALQGINVNLVSSVAMFLGCGLAAAAGALTGAIFDLSPYMGGFALMKGIAVIIMGGLGSIPGAIVGGLILGLVDGVVTPLLSVQMASIIGLAVIILVLLFRPQGLFGHE
jgi:branched-chain amino acid transport system permease protein